MKDRKITKGEKGESSESPDPSSMATAAFNTTSLLQGYSEILLLYNNLKIGIP